MMENYNGKDRVVCEHAENFDVLCRMMKNYNRKDRVVCEHAGSLDTS